MLSSAAAMIASLFLFNMVILLSLIPAAVLRGPLLDLQERMFIPDGAIDLRCLVAQVGRSGEEVRDKGGSAELS
jgi:hypothetical protein